MVAAGSGVMPLPSLYEPTVVSELRDKGVKIGSVRPSGNAEDALSGVAPGRAGNFRLVVGVARSGQHEALRHAGADVVVADLDEFEGDRHSPGRQDT